MRACACACVCVTSVVDDGIHGEDVLGPIGLQPCVLVDNFILLFFFIKLFILTIIYHSHYCNVAIFIANSCW